MYVLRHHKTNLALAERWHRVLYPAGDMFSAVDVQLRLTCMLDSVTQRSCTADHCHHTRVVFLHQCTSHATAQSEPCR